MLGRSEKKNVCAECRHYENCGRPERFMKCLGYEKAVNAERKTMIDVLMEKLLEEPVVDNNEIVFTSRAVELIHEISEKCKGIQIVEQTREQAEEYAKDLSAEEVYYDMLRKIVDAPTTLHMKCSVRMLVPIIDRKLKERGL